MEVQHMTPDQGYTLGVFIVFAAVTLISTLIKKHFDDNGWK